MRCKIKFKIPLFYELEYTENSDKISESSIKEWIENCANNTDKIAEEAFLYLKDNLKECFQKNIVLDYYWIETEED